jgi:thiopeptide-type bacteriocin biosynthesis protein
VNDFPWHQINITYPGDTPEQRGRHAVAHLHRVLPAAATAGLISAWWFIRKGAWRIRYQTGIHHNEAQARDRLTEGVTWTRDIYEPETHAFGGLDSMAAAHTLFCADSHHLLTYLHQHPTTDLRGRSLILCTALMRAAGLDLNEQGDVWARVVEQRAAHPTQPLVPDAHIWERFIGDVRHLILGNPRDTGDWHTAFAEAGTRLRFLRESGTLTRGLREVTALHVIFHWNRVGLPAATQATLACAASEAIFGPALEPAQAVVRQ